MGILRLKFEEAFSPRNDQKKIFRPDGLLWLGIQKIFWRTDIVLVKVHLPERSQHVHWGVRQVANNNSSTLISKWRRKSYAGLAQPPESGLSLNALSQIDVKIRILRVRALYCQTQTVFMSKPKLAATIDTMRNEILQAQAFILLWLARAVATLFSRGSWQECNRQLNLSLFALGDSPIRFAFWEGCN